MEIIGFLFMQTVVCLLAIGAGALCFLGVLWATRGVRRWRSWALLIAFLFPLMVTLYVEAAVVLYGLAEYSLGYDSFLDGIYHYPLTNGYQLVIFNKMPEMAYVDNKSRPNAGTISEVRAVQVSGHSLFVTWHKAKDEMDWGRDTPANRYAIINTDSSEIAEYPSLDALRLQAASQGTLLQLLDTEGALNKAASPGWKGRLFFCLILISPGLFAVWFIRKLMALRVGQPQSQPA